MTDRELMQMALDALELYQSKMSVQMFDDTVKALRARLAQPELEPVDKQGAPCKEFWDWLPKAYRDGDKGEDAKFTKYNMEVAYLAGKQSQPEQEPVAWVPVSTAMPKSGVTVLACYKNRLGNVRRIRAQWTAAKTEEASSDWDVGEYDEAADCYWTPEGWYECIDNWDEYSSVAVHEGEITHWMPMPTDPYTAPPQREWQGLTDEEIKDYWITCMWKIEGTSLPIPEFARAIEAALKEKNAETPEA